MAAPSPHSLVLLCRTRSLRCALPVSAVEETLRPLGVAPLAGLPPFVRGLSTVRGAAVPVVSAARLLQDTDEDELRWVSCRDGDRRLVLAWSSVDGIREMPASRAAAPALVTRCAPEALQELASDGDGLILLLRSARLLSEELWAAIERL